MLRCGLIKSSNGPGVFVPILPGERRGSGLSNPLQGDHFSAARRCRHSPKFWRQPMEDRCDVRVKIACNFKLVPLAGIEPALLAESDFESDASTSSAIGARANAAGGI